MIDKEVKLTITSDKYVRISTWSLFFSFFLLDGNVSAWSLLFIVEGLGTFVHDDHVRLTYNHNTVNTIYSVANISARATAKSFDCNKSTISFL